MKLSRKSARRSVFDTNNARDWVLAIGVMTLMVYGLSGIIYFTLELIQPKTEVKGVTLLVLASNLINSVSVLLACLLFSRFAHRFRPGWRQHLVLSGLLLVTMMIVNNLIWRTWLIKYINVEDIPRSSRNNISILYVLSPILVGNAFFYFQQKARTFTRKITDQEYQLLQMQQQKTRAELEALQAKINPHFLYNALNSIASLVHDDPDRAERMVLLLSKLFRYTTGLKNQYFNSIANELEMVRTYLDVEQVRFGDRLSYRIDLADPKLNEVQIPQFLLQPLVENAIKHGISKIAGPGAIIVRITEEGGRLRFHIHDNGPAFPVELVAGYGLQSVQDKLRLLYGEEARMLVQNQPLKEVIVELKPGARPVQPVVPDLKTAGA
ncbi:sensor histidine kinase [Larkinella soli]|uniref:sensor histidine kinase n=1 Tax=Larkinella soli TaxID=1770527 RepID=UPI000FFB93C4|nr:histidine kinase [Larkinella soli]